MNLNIDDKVMVVLKEQCYFDLWAAIREVRLLQKEAMQKQLLGMEDPKGWTKYYKSKKYKEKGIIAIKGFAGIYVGERPGEIKIQPLYGLQHQFSEYFIISEDQIKEIRKDYTESLKELVGSSNISTKNQT